ncbi:hypothetical protein, partial [Pseudomonas sp. UBA5706]|uniref:hypothetical protein n=1 Tax=Pseudomonas sp. UBA5706 TaxID=1947321 RepID=UPI0025CFA507
REPAVNPVNAVIQKDRIFRPCDRSRPIADGRASRQLPGLQYKLDQQSVPGDTHPYTVRAPTVANNNKTHETTEQPTYSPLTLLLFGELK